MTYKDYEYEEKKYLRKNSFSNIMKFVVKKKEVPGML
jgi:hypothetical protein